MSLKLFHVEASVSLRFILVLWHERLWLMQSNTEVWKNRLWLCICLKILIASLV